MKRSKVHCLFLLLFSPFLFPQKTKKAVFVIADGIPYDRIMAHKMPNLLIFAKNGGLVPAYVGGKEGDYTETPTISAVGYNSLLTGTWAYKHNVWDNDIVAPNYSYWNLFRLYKAQYPKGKTAIFSTWEDNRTKLIGQYAKDAGNFKPDYIFDGYERDTIQFPNDKDGNFYNAIDNFVMQQASETIRKSAPDLSWIYLEYTDEMGHRHGDSKEFEYALDELDKQIGMLYHAVKYRETNFNEEWLVVITTDHGRDITGYNHGGQSHREKNTWIATNFGDMNKYFFTEQPAIVDIAPSILRYLNVELPKDRAFEIDGVPMIGKLSGTNLSAKFCNGKIELHWLAENNEGMAKIWLSSTNNFKNSGTDHYQLMKEVQVNAQEAEINVGKIPSKFYKIAVEMPYNTLNRWIILQ